MGIDCKINTKLLPIKVHYFVYFAGVAALWPFIQVCGRQMGISELSVGVIFTVAPVAGIICNPLFGALADKYRIKKKLFLTFIFLNTVALLSFALLPFKDIVSTVDNEALLTACNSPDGDLGLVSTSPSSLLMSSRIQNQSESVTSNDGILDIDKKYYDDGIGLESPVFWLYGILVLAGWVAMAVVTSVADALCFQTLGENHHLYGYQRQWGAVGWGGATFLAGYLIDTMSEPNQPKNYNPCFYLVAIFMVIALFVSYTWKVEEEEKPKSMGKNLFELILQPRIGIFMLVCITVGICTGLQWNFLYWYVEDLASSAESSELECEYTKWIKLIQGAIAAVQCLAEVPFFYVSGKLIKKLGHVNCMSLVLAAFGIRFLFYSVITNPWMILPIELLQGLTYGIFYSTMASYAFIASPPGTGATVQSIVAAAFEGIGVGTGSILAGACFKVFTGRMAFRLFGILALTACALHIISMIYINKSSKDHHYEPPKCSDDQVEPTPEDSQQQGKIVKTFSKV